MRRLTPQKFTDVTMEGSFWRERLETVLTRTIPSQHKRLIEHGIIGSLSLPKPVPPLRIPCNRHNFTTQIFWDSDVGKWIEAASYALAHRRDEAIEKKIDDIADTLAKAQAPDGYLNCWYLGRDPEKRWTNLRDNHELYCAGHMLEGAIAYFQSTGRRRLLDIMCRYVDHIATVFGPGPEQKRGYCGHQEIELALIKLYHVSGDTKHLGLADYFINERGNRPHYFDMEAKARGDDPAQFWAKTYEYNQSHMPVREQTKVVGHAVRAMYMYAAMADLAALLDDLTLKQTCEILWNDLTGTRMYVTGGLGPSASNEGFTQDYDLPNDTAYAETCASVALIFWAQRMLNFDCDSAYADILELALYNGALAGLSMDGTHYFYENRLDSDGSHHRWEWHSCPCCTMNVSRLIASVGGYFYATADDTLAVHLYGANSATLALGRRQVKVRQVTDYPWNGDMKLTIDPQTPLRFALRLRIPGWAKSETIRINGMSVERVTKERGYAVIEREWHSGDEVDLHLPMPVERLYAHPNVKADIGRVCLKRGPFVYCAEEADNPEAAIPRLKLPRDAAVRTVERDDLFGGIVGLTAEARLAETKDWNGNLYRTAPPASTATTMDAIPYYAWSNRGPGKMMVWLPE